MMHHAATFSGSVAKRALEMREAYVGDGQGEMNELPGWAWLVFFADFLVFFPIFVYVGYTLSHIYPTLAMIEDPEPPPYEPVDLNDSDSIAEDNAPLDDRPVKVDQEPVLVTSSLRSINRLLYSTAGWTANLRGLPCAIVLSLAAGASGAIFSGVPFVPRSVGVLLASLVTVQLSTAWTHIVISAPSTLRFYQRLPPFGKTFQATAVPIVVYWAATQLTAYLPIALSYLLGLAKWDVRNPTQVPQYGGDIIWKSFVLALVVVAAMVFLVIPAQVMLVRVQASLLPPDESPILAFDRSFAGAVEPPVVGGKGYVTYSDAWRTFSRQSWIRLYKLIGKIIAVEFAVYVLFVAIVVPEFILTVKASRPVDSN
ncbi:hypothetical protein KVR01_003784 [Diaporthe batatas]|uniref:uncharacterized protein n=1 Tax=Diaporthe batatas TaxID=748121 RepID=UPI001D04238C|nr:uncharacterized protein KVR01_003784 [Diaporthe batatas]KAG8168095.1 hypothetical protein KVR01_003784 [Diaporthe batatas]